MAAGQHPASKQARDRVVLGVVGGSGLYGMDALVDVESVEVDTPFGKPSAAYTVGKLPRESGEPVKTVFLPRHAPGHPLMPSEINYRANIHGFKQLGVTHLLAVSAVGSLRERVEPGHLVVVDQFIDRTKGRENTFFGGGIVGHVQFGDPTSPEFSVLVRDAASSTGATVHPSGTCIVMEGPAFSTRAESELYRSWGADVIGMTGLPEAKLAREAEIGYGLLALSTDYDCWHTEEVTVEAVVAVVKANVARAQEVIAALARRLPETTAELPWPAACEHAIITARSHISAEAKERLDLIVGHYLQESK